MKNRLSFFFFLSLIFAVFNTSIARTYYVSTTGNDLNVGYTIDAPFLTMKKALGKSDGDTIIVRGGTYYLTGDSTISVSKDGIALGKTFFIMNYPGETPIFNGSLLNAAKKCIDIKNTARNWHITGLHFTKARDNGMYISGAYNIIERCSFYENEDSGLQLSNGANNNQIINCDSYFNKDATSENADGFACKLDVGTGNSFKGCRAWQNSDDGWDGYLRPSDNVTTTLENCWAFRNGYLKTGATSGANGDGNGFKMGGSDATDLSHNMTLTNCLAFNNRKRGFDQNNNRGSMTLYNNVAFGNNSGNFIMNSIALDAGSVMTVKNCIAYTASGTAGSNSFVSGAIVQNNSWQGPSVTNADFMSLDTAGARGPRKPDGSLPDINFMRLAPGSDLIDAGQDVGLPYNGTNPDLGAFETGTPAAVESYIFTGNGNWTDASNWLDNKMPTSPLPAGTQITIDPANGGECVLNTPYTVTPGVVFTVMSGKVLRVTQ